MHINLDDLQKSWEKDSKLDMDNLHTESTNIPSLHAKYFEMYNTIFTQKESRVEKNIRHERYEYFNIPTQGSKSILLMSMFKELYNTMLVYIF